jgi:hypothetical protein
MGERRESMEDQRNGRDEQLLMSKGMGRMKN